MKKIIRENPCNQRLKIEVEEMNHRFCRLTQIENIAKIISENPCNQRLKIEIADMNHRLRRLTQITQINTD